MKHTEDRHPPVILANVNNLIQELHQQAGWGRGVERKAAVNCQSALVGRSYEQEPTGTEGN